MKKPILVLIDGSAVFHRGYHAIPPLSTRDGLPTNAVLGFANIMLRILGELKPTYAIVAWDKSSDTFRRDQYPAYKATRIKQPDDLYAQIPTTHELVDALRIPWIEVEKYEADDIIGTFARQAEVMGGLDIVIATGDKDQLQLIDHNTVVDMFNPRNPEPTRYDLAKMQEKYGLTPQQFIDYKGLVGDSSDNIPGVTGIGDVGARKLLGEYHTLEGVYEHLDEITGGIHDKLEVGREIAFLSRDLSRIICDVPGLQLDLEPAKLGQYDRQHVHDLFRKLEFKQLLSKLPPELRVDSTPTLFGDNEEVKAPERSHLSTANYQAVTTSESLDKLVAQLAKQPAFAVDTETDSLDTMSANLVGLSISWSEGEAYYVPVGHKQGIQLPCDEVIAALKPILEDPQIGKIGHNIKFDYEVLRRYGVAVGPVACDTMVAAFLVNSLGRAQSLDDLAYNELGIEMIPISELIGSGKSVTTFDHSPIEEATKYAAEDADISWRLYVRLMPQLEKMGLTKLASDMEWPLIPVLGEMEIAGIELDAGFLREFSKKLVAEISALKIKIWEAAGEEFNIASPAQLAQILYGRLGLSTVGLKKGKTGFSTAAGELDKLRNAHPIVDFITQYRELEKLRSTYADALPEMVSKVDGRVHTSFSQVIAQTGRLSSNNPNLQNIPVRTELGREIRRAFVAPKGRVFASADYSQIELRVAAALSRDEAMIKTFRDGIDLHQQTAAELYAVPLDAVTKEQRYNAKTINFGVLYGMSAHGLSVATGMEREMAAGFIERYFDVRPKLATYIEETKEFARKHGYTATLFGRRRPCPEINSNNFQIKQGAERMAVNVPIQGTAADIYKLAMIALAPKLEAESKLLLQIHDELIVETDAAKGEAVAAVMKDVMENIYDLGVPLSVDTAIGTNWGELK